jgi:predicted  nucleic acid-binding Zn-ribbon protein
LETTLRCCEAALRENQRKLTFTPNPKEYKNLEQKIAVEEQKIAQLEELWLNKTLEMESKEAELAGLQQTSNGEAQKLQEEWNRQEQYSQNLEGNRAELRGKIEAMRKIVKESHNHWLRPYDETKKAVRKMPCIVELRGGNFCGGCNLKLSDYSNLTANPQFPFAVCESCARLILLQDKT